MKRLIVLAVTAALIAVAASPASAAPTVYTGQWLCGDRGAVLPLGGIEVQLWRRGWDWFPAEITGGQEASGFTNEDGTFSLTAADGVDTHFVRMALRDAAGVHLKDFWGINDWSIDTSGSANDVPARDLGGLLLATTGESHKCAVWRGFHLAHADFRALMGFNPPSGGLLINADAITAGVPFTPHTTVMWPAGYNAGDGAAPDDSTTRHEFGHVIRHGYDGDLGHFLGDVVTHNYLRQHQRCLRTGLGFAFNEGWANYWAGDVAAAPACPGLAADDFEVEGNVATALAQLAANCYGGQRAPMVNVLRANPGVIHSFREFQALAPCPAPLLVAVRPTAAAASVSISPARAARLAAADVRGAAAELRGLRVELRRAERAARVAPVCPSSPCTSALRRATRPAALRTEIGLAQLVRDTVDDSDTVAEQRRLRKLSIAAAVKLMKAKEKANRRRAAGILARGAREALEAARPVFAIDESAATRRIRSLIASRLARFRKAQQGGPAVAVVLDQAIADRIRKVAERNFPAPAPTPTPTPTPTPEPRAISTLTLTCPSGGKPGVYALAGALTPARAGTEIELHVTPPNGTETVVKTTTDASSAYSMGQVMQTAGTWKIFARWAGDPTALPDDSPTCDVTV